MADLPKTYKAAVAEKANEDLVIRELPLKMPEVGQVLVKVLACGVCHSDSAVLMGYMGEMPRVPGHEAVGDVVAVGEGESKWKVGDRVGAPWHGGHEGRCKSCTRGMFQMCVDEKINGISFDGGYAEYVLLRSEAVVSVPKDIDPAEVAPLLCAGVTVFNSMRQQNILAGSLVAVQGLGGLGHLAIQYASKMGFRTVALSSSDSKRDFASKLGAHDYIDGSKEDTAAKLKEMGGAAMIVCTAPNPKGIEPLIAGLESRGKLLVVAIVGNLTLDTGVMVHDGLTLQCWPSGHAADCEDAISFAQRSGVTCMIEKFPLEKAAKAYKHMMSGKARFRAVLVM
ncbi:MAG: hypothetical protein M1814_006866 [Vezdaea aestivalis]|nr:MAG: hypothetical protein M1814_006866 [Vezdaea aestivalis]